MGETKEDQIVLRHRHQALILWNNIRVIHHYVAVCIKAPEDVQIPIDLGATDDDERFLTPVQLYTFDE